MAAFRRPASCRARPTTSAISLDRTEDTWANVQAHPLHRRLLALEGGRSRSDRDAGLRRRELGGPGAAYARHAGGLQAHAEPAEMAGGPRPEEMGALLPAGEPAAKRVAFFDHFLKDEKTSLAAWPKVRLEVRETRRRRRGARRERMAARAHAAMCRSGSTPPAGSTPRRPKRRSVRYDAAKAAPIFDEVQRGHRTHRSHEAEALGRGRGRGRHGPVRRRCRSSMRRATTSASTFYAFFENGRSPWAGCAQAIARSIRSGRRPNSPSIRTTARSLWRPASRSRSRSRSGRPRPCSGQARRCASSSQGSDIYKEGLPRPALSPATKRRAIGASTSSTPAGATIRICSSRSFRQRRAHERLRRLHELEHVFDIRSCFGADRTVFGPLPGGGLSGLHAARSAARSAGRGCPARSCPIPAPTTPTCAPTASIELNAHYLLQAEDGTLIYIMNKGYLVPAPARRCPRSTIRASPAAAISAARPISARRRGRTTG